MGSIGPFQLLIIAVVILILFGRGRISEMMGDFGKGVKSFRKGMNEDDEAANAEKKVELARLSHEAKPAGETVESSTRVDTKSDNTVN